MNDREAEVLQAIRADVRLLGWTLIASYSVIFMIIGGLVVYVLAVLLR